MLPYSNKRRAWAAWPELYRVATDEIRKRSYVDKVERYLEARQSAGNPPPYFIGVVVLDEDQDQIYVTEADERNRERLERKFGDDHAILYSLRFVRAQEKAKIVCEPL